MEDTTVLEILNNIKNLNPRDRLIIKLYYFEDVAFKDIITIMKIRPQIFYKLFDHILNSIKPRGD